MNLMRPIVVTLVSLVLLVSANAAAQNTIDSPLAQTVIRVSNAVGVVLEPNADYSSYLDELVRLGVIIPNTQLVTDVEFVTTPNEFTGGGFCIFLADVLAGLEPDPGFLAINEQEFSFPAAQRVSADESYLQGLDIGIVSCDEAPTLDALGGILADPEFGSDDPYSSPTSVIGPGR